MADTPYRVLILNNISAKGLQRLPKDRYVHGRDIADPDAILVRSADMHSMSIPSNVKAIGRAGAGTNNIPVAALSQRGIAVFNAPGANANAVKELVLAGMLLASRNLVSALHFVAALKGEQEKINQEVENGKKAFAGFELAQHTIGIIGLGKIGSLVADAAIKLGMNVLGYDPEITVDAAWSLPAQVRKAHSVEEVLRNSHFISLHVPLTPKTQDLINSNNIEAIKSGAVLVNFAREKIVNEQAIVQALAQGKLRYYVCDFPSPLTLGHPQVIALPHLGASTSEAEDNSAVMVIDQLRAYLEHGNVQNAVNFPDAVMPRESPYRLAIANANVPNMVSQISACVAKAQINIHDMLNKSRGEMAYTIVDLDSPVSSALTTEITQIKGVLAVRYLQA